MVSKAALVTENTLKKNFVIHFDKTICDVCETKARGISYKPFNINSFYMRVCDDPSCAANDEIFSEIGHILLLCVDMNDCSVLEFSCHKQ